MTINSYPPLNQEPNNNGDKDLIIGILVCLLCLAFLGWFVAESDNEILRSALLSPDNTQVPQ